MALPFKPHSVTWLARQSVLDGNRVVGHTWSAMGSFAALWIPHSSRDEQDQFGSAPENLSALLCDLSDSEGINAGDRIAVEDRLWRVVATPRLFASGLAADHARIELREVTE